MKEHARSEWQSVVPGLGEAGTTVLISESLELNPPEIKPELTSCLMIASLS